MPAPLRIRARATASLARFGVVLLACLAVFAAGVSQAAAVVPVVNSFAPTASATSGTSLSFNLVFNTSVTGLTTGDFSLGGSASGWAISGLTGSGATYVLTVDGTSGGEGTVTPTLAANSVTDSTSTLGPTASRAAT
jgi:hypothetical protein